MEGTPENKKGGRPTKYHKSFDRIAYELCRRHGYTNEKLADVLGIGLTTLKEWERRHKGFQAAVRQGKDEFDCEQVESALLKRAKGFVRRKLIKRTYFKRGRERTETREVLEEVAGNVEAERFWLKNRNPQRWKETISAEVMTKSAQDLAQEINDMLLGMTASVPAQPPEPPP